MVWNLTATKEELQQHLLNTYSDEHRSEDIQDIEGVMFSSAPGVQFDCKPPRLAEIQQIVP